MYYIEVFLNMIKKIHKASSITRWIAIFVVNFGIYATFTFQRQTAQTVSSK